MADPKVTSYETQGNIDAGEMLRHTGQDSAGNSIYAAVSNPSGFVNVATLTCANAEPVNLAIADQKGIKQLLDAVRDAAPSSFLGITYGEGEPSPLAPLCGPDGSTSKTR